MREKNNYPEKILHWINNQEVESIDGEYFSKINPDTGKEIGKVTSGKKADSLKAIESANIAYEKWSETSIVERSNILRNTTILMQERREEIAHIVAIESGKSFKDAFGEVGAAIEMGFFVSGEGRRNYGKTTTSGVPDRTAMIVRKPVGICSLITASNTPIANVAWKAFPALLCGNTAIMKPSEDTPYTAIIFAKLLKESGLPEGVFSVINGFGETAGQTLVEDEKVSLVSFTGSVEVGKYIQKTAGERLAKVCLELGGKNAMVVCEDSDLEIATESAVLSAFSNAGQRCASGSRIIVFESIYNKFKTLMLEKTSKLKLGISDNDDLGPVINESQMNNILNSINNAIDRKEAELLTGGKRDDSKEGFYIQPTILENVNTDSDISKKELFGPVTCLYKVKDFHESIKLVNNSSFGLTAAIHTNNINRIQEFQKKCKVGVISINGHTYGSEPHMPFGGHKDSGNGFREAGTEALDVYSEWQTVYIKHYPDKV